VVNAPLFYLDPQSITSHLATFSGVQVSCQPDTVASTVIVCVLKLYVEPPLETFYWVNISRYGETRSFAMDMENTVWLADSWLNRIVHAHVRLVTVRSPDFLRLDRRHNQAESDQRVI
jgi:hypothetical protein